MRISELFSKNATVGDTLSAPKGRSVMSRRFEPSMATFISPIERWADNNYVPYDLDYLYTQKTESSEIIAPLHGFHAQDVFVDISRGHVIILLSRNDYSAYPSRQEFYCEVPLPPDAKYNQGHVEIGSHFLTVHLNQKRSMFKRAVSAACRVKLSWQRS